MYAVAEIDQGSEVAVLLPFFDDVVECGLADIFYRRQAKTNLVIADTEVLNALIDVRGKYLNLVFPALVDVDNNFVGIVHVAGQKSGHELGRIVGFEIGGLVSDEGIRSRMRLVESVARKFGHQVKYVFRFLFVYLVLPGTGHELFFLLVHNLWYLLAHGPSQDIGIAKAVIGQHVGNFHHLFLVDDNPVGLFKYRFKLGQRVVGLLTTMLGVDKILDHA